ncbi:MAG: hypothetical protein B5766_12565 [Candidatus Lumbricidophila eiseniae]|uniref:Probable membrane transporter protein n=1 Tax=Candidatus Lumbricidiphila eiseniae TaxID=1969409 RepID=A0A2A6FMZ7_9MICO|nr:MAG: hypothetical protein B5766_12565 [Candidatus Lumbricidophila eiseniae]
MSDSASLLGAGFAVLAGASAQRATGLGFGLVSAPFLTLALGPHNGVGWANLLASCVAGAVLLTSVRNVDWPRAWRLAAGALLGVIPGILLGRFVPAPVVQVIVGGLVLLALGVVVFTRERKLVAVPGGAWSAGVLSGFMGASAGVGGPPLALYAKSTDWWSVSFVPTAQVVFIVTGVTSVVSRGISMVNWSLTVVMVVGLAVGLVVGHLIARRIPETLTLNLALTLAALGSIATIVTGVRGLVCGEPGCFGAVS